MILPPKVVLLIGEESRSIKAMYQTLSEAYEAIHFEQAEEEIQYFDPSTVIIYQNGDSRSEVIQQLLRVQRYHPKAPIVLCSSSESKAPITACPRGVTACLRWPEEEKQLLPKVRKLSSWLFRFLQRLTGRASKIDAADTVTCFPAQPAAVLQISCFGGFEMKLRGNPLPSIKSEVDQAILAYLFIHPEGQGLRERMISGFWPLNNEKAARNCLNVSMSHNRAYLRQYIGEGCTIDLCSNAYQLNLGLSWECDAEAFTRLRKNGEIYERQKKEQPAIQAYQDAVNLYQGDFLEHLTREIHWVESIRSQMQDAYLTILDRLIVLLLRRNRYTEAIAAAEKILEVDTCIESAHRYIMNAYAKTGHRSKAIRQYQLCREALQKMLEVDPTRETNALYRELTRTA